jgi:hypothetical protein
VSRLDDDAAHEPALGCVEPEENLCEVANLSD